MKSTRTNILKSKIRQVISIIFPAMNNINSHFNQMLIESLRIYSGTLLIPMVLTFATSLMYLVFGIETRWGLWGGYKEIWLGYYITGYLFGIPAWLWHEVIFLTIFLTNWEHVPDTSIDVNNFAVATRDEYILNLNRLRIKNHAELVGKDVYYSHPKRGIHRVVDWDAESGQYMISIDGRCFQSSPFILHNIS